MNRFCKFFGQDHAPKDNFVQILKQDYHRNGVSGAPFKIAIVKDDSKKLIIQFGEKSNCAVLDLELLKKGIIEFGENSWRGDAYSHILTGDVE